MSAHNLFYQQIPISLLIVVKIQIVNYYNMSINKSIINIIKGIIIDHKALTKTQTLADNDDLGRLHICQKSILYFTDQKF